VQKQKPQAGVIVQKNLEQIQAPAEHQTVQAAQILTVVQIQFVLADQILTEFVLADQILTEFVLAAQNLPADQLQFVQTAQILTAALLQPVQAVQIH
jgi:hypothetical protein